MVKMGLTDFLRHHLLTCPSKAILHMECPGCGMQRSFLCLLEGKFRESFYLHPATIPVLVLFLFLLAHLVYRFKHGANIIIFLQFTVAIITSVFYIYKIFTHKIFI